MELNEFIERYLPGYHKRLEELYAEYRWWDRPVTNEVLCKWHSENFREAFNNYNNQLMLKEDMSKLKHLQYGDFLIKGKNLKEVMIENKFYRRHIDHLGRLSKNALPF